MNQDPNKTDLANLLRELFAPRERTPLEIKCHALTNGTSTELVSLGATPEQLDELHAWWTTASITLREVVVPFEKDRFTVALCVIKHLESLLKLAQETAEANQTSANISKSFEGI